MGLLFQVEVVTMAQHLVNDKGGHHNMMQPLGR